MSKTGNTKSTIIDILGKKNETLTDLSRKLNLAPSTVSQHLQELMDSGDIRLVEDRPRKWKYYELNNANDNSGRRGGFDIRGLRRAAATSFVVVALVLVAAFLLLSRHGTSGYLGAQPVYITPGSAVPAGSTVFSVSDSPSLYNISALFITVDNLSVHSTSTGKWYNVKIQTSTFNLVALKNISAIMSGTKLQAGEYNEIALNISNAIATVNGTNESVLLPSGRLRIFGDFNISNSTNSSQWLNLDFDLEHSLHMTGNGTLIMTPVINFRQVSDNSLELNQNSIIVAKGPGRIRAYWEMGMDDKGNMKYNYSMPQNTVIEMRDGHVILNGIGPVPLVVRGHGFLIFGGDESNIINMSANAEDYNAIAANGIVVLHCFGSDYVEANGINMSNATAFAKGCCYPASSNGREFGRCYRPPEGERIQVQVNRKEGLDVSARALNNGSFEDIFGMQNNSTMLNISQGSNGITVDIKCNYENGAMTCTRNGNVIMPGSIPIPSIIGRWSNGNMEDRGEAGAGAVRNMGNGGEQSAHPIIIVNTSSGAEEDGNTVTVNSSTSSNMETGQGAEIVGNVVGNVMVG